MICLRKAGPAIGKGWPDGSSLRTKGHVKLADRIDQLERRMLEAVGTATEQTPLRPEVEKEFLAIQQELFGLGFVKEEDIIRSV